MKVLAAILCLLLSQQAPTAFADIYKCVHKGIVFHTNDPSATEQCDASVREEYRLKEIEKAAIIAAAEKKKAASRASAEKTRLAKGRVKIGMSQKEVLASSWGKPVDVSRTTTAAGTREQWVYGNKNYLYFDHGILTAIQE